ncbi:MAG: SRPBCC domain-containing protein [Chitinophagaceae bacterium]|nr:MAG: SRPBCC domain-containing protein [Chitinophagaceae bacterium]
MENRSINSSVTIYASPSRVWDTLTNPSKIVQYLGSHVNTDWAEGSPIIWEGDMQGTKFTNKGQVLESKEHELLKFTYWSGMGGDPDVPHNYSEISYKLTDKGNGQTEFTFHREKIPTEMEQQVFDSHLPTMLHDIKRISEDRS